MATQEVGTPITLVSPRTGEVLTLDAPTEALGVFLADVREFKSMLDEAQNYAQREIVSRMDKQAKWTVHANGYRLTAPSPSPAEEWNGAELREQLLDLVESGELAIEAVDAAVEVVVTYKPHKAGINALRKLGGTPARIINSLVQTPEKPRRVTVTRSTP